MNDRDVRVQAALEAYMPVRADERPLWHDVLRRAGVEPGGFAPPPPELRSRRRLGRFALALALLACAVVLSPFAPAVAGLGRDAFDGLSSWLRDEPGTPAPPAEQSGFAVRNAASYAAFPEGTTVRLLLRRTVGGKTFSLLGWRSNSSLCLRLARSDRPAGRGANQCVTLRELRRSAAPALVVSDAWFRFGDPETTVDGVFGFADDTTETIEVRRARSGWSATDVVSNVFVTLRARPTGTVANHPPSDPAVQVRAVTRDGSRVSVPFVARDFGDYAGGVPTRPSYLRHEPLRPEALPGPAEASARFTGGTIGWLERREPRGEPFTPEPRLLERLGTLVFARRVRPDPHSPFRVGIALIRVTARAPATLAKPGSLTVCDSPIEPLGRATGASCGHPGPSGPMTRAITVGYVGPSQITRLSGLAADTVTRVELYLATGRVIPAALNDNAYVVEAPTSQFPAKLVAYDGRGRVLAIQVLPGSPKPEPCPVTTFSGDARGLGGAPRPYERLDLGSAHLGGAEIFGRGPAEVRAGLGQPSRIAHFSRSNDVREPTFFYGGTTQSGAAVLVRFGYRQHRLRAISLSLQSPRVVDRRLGHVLRVASLELQRRLASAYASVYRLDVGYGMEPSRGCVGTYKRRGGPLELTFGIDPRRPSRPFLLLARGY